MRRPSALALAFAFPLAFVCAVAIRPAIALAQPSPAKEGAARSLFDEARALFTAGKTSEACAKFGESYALEKKGTTLLNLAICHEREGKIASAWTEFSEARAQAARDGNAERVQLAEERANALAKRVPQMRLEFAEPHMLGLAVRLDGQPIDGAALDAQIPLDPGPHALDVIADNKKAWHGTVTAAIGASATVSVPVLEPAVAETAPVSSSSPSPPQIQDTPPLSASAKSDDDGHGRRTLAIVMFGGAVVGGGIGAYFGIHAFSQRSDAEDQCRAGHCDDGRRTNDKGTTSAWIANGAIGAAVILGAVGAYLLITAPHSHAHSAETSAISW